MHLSKVIEISRSRLIVLRYERSMCMCEIFVETDFEIRTEQDSEIKCILSNYQKYGLLRGLRSFT